MNKGELKTIVDDFVELREALKSKFDCPINTADRIASQIIAGKAANGDYKNKNYYHHEGRQE